MSQERLAPDSILAIQNLSGTVADIDDDPDSPDGAWLTAPGSNNETSVRVSFPTPSGDLDATANAQTVRALVRKTNHNQEPFATLYLYENGSQVKILQAETGITSTTGQVMSGTFSASEINNPANVEVFIQGFVGGGNPGNRASMEVGAIEWNAEITAAGTDATVDDPALVGSSANNASGKTSTNSSSSVITATANDATVKSEKQASAGVAIASASNDNSTTLTTSNATPLTAALAAVANGTTSTTKPLSGLAGVAAVANNSTVETGVQEDPTAEAGCASVTISITTKTGNTQVETLARCP